MLALVAAATCQSNQQQGGNAAQYSFQYDVDDPFTGDSKSQSESRDGDTVRGQYTVNDPDGTTRIVDYSSDPVNGFKVSINRQPNGAAPYVPASPYSRYAPNPYAAYGGASPYGASPYGASPYGSYPYAYPGYPQPAAARASAAQVAQSQQPSGAASSQTSAVGVGAGASSTLSAGAPAPAPVPAPVYPPPPPPPAAAPYSGYYPRYLPYASYDPLFNYGYPFPYTYGQPRYYRSVKK